MKSFLTIWAALSLLVGGLAPALAQEPIIGSVRTVEGQAQLVRQGVAQPADLSQTLLLGDKLVTGPDGSLGILLRDDTSIALGPESELIIEEYMFAPVEGLFGLGAKIAKGSAAFISGKIGKMKPEAVRVTTPVATIGVRGTRFLVQAQGQ